MQEGQLSGMITEALYEHDDEEGAIDNINSFSEEGALTNDTGIVVRMANGDKFFVTVVKQ